MAKILVIEDEFDIRDEVINWLQFEGHQVFGAEDGKRGLELIRQENPDLVLCDISMPNMDGHEVLIEVRSDANSTQLPFVFLTSAADRESMRKGMNMGADDYLTKPFSHAEVINAVRTRLQRSSAIQTQMDYLTQVIEAEREQHLLKSRLIGMFSHDFRNPLASILMSSNILQSYDDRMTPERKKQHFHRIDSSVHVLLQMLDDMLIVAEIENGQLSAHPQPMNLSNLIEKIIADFRVIDGAQHQITFSSDLPEVVALDSKLLNHVLVNLVSNSLKYSPKGSQIDIKAFAHNGQILITVEDAGIGIAEEDLPRIFDAFFRADNAHGVKGTGLGLALVKQALDVCDGRVEVTSEIGQGSCFTIYLPLRTGEVRSS